MRIVQRLAVGSTALFALYVLSFGPVWGIYKRGYVFSKESVRLIYTPLVDVADLHLCPMDWPGNLLWEYAELFAPPENPKVLSTNDTFD